MAHRVTIERLHTEPSDEQNVTSGPIKLYEQTVDALDLNAVIAAINRKPRAPRKRKGEAAA